MTIDRVTYTKTFATGPYLNEKIGVEIQLDAGEQPENALDMAKRTVEVWHKINNPHLDYSVIPDGSPLPTREVERDSEFILEIEKEIKKMGKCKTYTEAEAFLAASPFKYHLELKAILQSKLNNS